MVAEAMSMAAGEYVSVHSQADTEQADLKLECAELIADDKGEHQEPAAIYVGRGLDPSLAKQFADQLMAHDAIGAHAVTSSAYPRLSGLVRFRLHLPRPAASLWERPRRYICAACEFNFSRIWNITVIPRALWPH